VALDPYLKDKEFDPEFIRSKSAAAAGLCSWVINIVKFFEVWPKSSFQIACF
jgi:dynein heavy chain